MSRYEVWSTGGEKLREIESLPIEAETEVVFTYAQQHSFSRIEQHLNKILSCANGNLTVEDMLRRFGEIEEAAKTALCYIPKKER